MVASEVRSLAGRSAEAAKEIKTLINASVERVAQGTALVDQAGATMTEVVGSIRRVTDIMGQITSASDEQSQGVAQVGQAVQQMDQVTQQNAALVEEMAAAASSLQNPIARAGANRSRVRSKARRTRRWPSCPRPMCAPTTLRPVNSRALNDAPGVYPKAPPPEAHPAPPSVPAHCPCPRPPKPRVIRTGKPFKTLDRRYHWQMATDSYKRQFTRSP